ncbi:MAG: hypothetical protein ACREJX_01305, partial [Polyangiaceae bacterium]
MLPASGPESPLGPPESPPAPPSPPPARPAIAPTPLLLRVQFVISRYQGDKKISSEPYTMTVRANEPRTNLRVGLQVAIPTSGPDNK